MRVINVSGKNWKTPRDFYDGVICALGGPDWHGRNMNALVESIVYGDINEINLPYEIRLSDTAFLDAKTRDEIAYFRESLAIICEDYKKRTGREAEVRFEITS